MNAKTIQDIENLENVVTTCYCSPRGDELPQVANADQIISSLTETL